MTDPNARVYKVVDVFTENPLEGNALAVFLDGSGLSDATMQSIARELNLSETVFLFPPTQPECAASLRIFTPAREMVFAGHPTVGTAFVLLAEKMVSPGTNRFILEEKIGPVPIRIEMRDRPLIWLSTPPIQRERRFDRRLCAAILGLAESDLIDIPPQLLSAGNPTVFIALKDKEAVDRASLDTSGMLKLKGVPPDPGCVFIFAPTPEGAYSRMFAPEYGIVEDPATGSSTGPLAAYMLDHGLAPSASSGARFISEQGTKMKRRSLLYVQINGEAGADGIDVGGYVTPLVHAVMQLDGKSYNFSKQ